VACRTETPWSDLHRLPVLLMKDRRHPMVCAANACDGHRLSPLRWGITLAACQSLAQALRPLLAVWMERCGIDYTQDAGEDLHYRTAFKRRRSSAPRPSVREVGQHAGAGSLAPASAAGLGARSGNCHTTTIAQGEMRRCRPGQTMVGRKSLVSVP
jgi:hypothetical protein